MNLSLNFPSSSPGAVVDIKKGRATIPFTQDEINFAMNFFSLLSITPPPSPAPVASGAGPVVDVAAEVVQ